MGREYRGRAGLDAYTVHRRDRRRRGAGGRLQRHRPRRRRGVAGADPHTAEPAAACTEAEQAQRLLDCDDLLLYWRMALQEDAIARAMDRRFDHVLIDEMQDTNRLQAYDAQMILRTDAQGESVVDKVVFLQRQK
ncbi:MAG: UvrD-helicase domain-containing protein [Rubrivivax sp.]